MLRTLVVLSLASCAATPTPVTPSPAPVQPVCAPRDEAGVIKAVVDMYAAFKVDDRAAFNAVATPDFYSFEGGKRMDGNELLALLADAHAKGRRFEWSVQDPSVRMDCNVAVITYVNVGAVGDAAAMQPVSWVESAELIYKDGGWRIRFFHSTRVPPAAPH